MRRPRGSRSRIFAVAGVVISLIATAFLGAAAPATASATPVVERVNAFSAFDSTVYKTVRAVCPPGRQVIGTGYRLLGAEGSIVLDDLIPDQTSVLVGAGEIVGAGEASDGTTANWQIEATAVCVSSGSFSLQIFSATSEFKALPGAGHRTQDPPYVTVNCPAGTMALGMGESVNNGFGQVSIDGLHTGDAGTSVHAHASTDLDGFSGAWSVTAYAICGPALTGLHQEPLLNSNFDSSSPQTLSRTCPAGQVALNAGWGGTWDRVDVTVNGADLVTQAGLSTGYVLTATEEPPGSSLNWDLASTMSCADGVDIPLTPVFDLNGAWNSGTGSTRPIITETGGIMSVNMSAFGRPTARGGVADSGHITISFPDDRTYSGTLVLPNRINWSNGTSWTKA